MLEIDRIYNADCIEGMRQIPSGGGRLGGFRPSIRDKL